MARSNSDPVAAAVAATDAELFHASLNNEAAVYDDTGDRSLEEQDDGLEGKVEDLGDDAEVETQAEGTEEGAEGEVEAKDGEKEERKRDEDGKFVKAKAEGEAEPATPVKDEQQGRVPASKHKEVAERARAAEARAQALESAREEDKRERDALKAQMDLLSRQVMQRQQPQPQQVKTEAPVRPDMFADPDGYNQWVENQINQRAERAVEDTAKRFINMSLMQARRAHGEKFDEAYKEIVTAAQSQPEARIAINKIWQSYDPGYELMQWHSQQSVLREFGLDPEAAIQKRIDAAIAAKEADPEYRKALFAKLSGGTEAGNGTPRHVTRGPTNLKSLNSAAGSARLSGADIEDDGSDDALFQHALRAS